MTRRLDQSKFKCPKFRLEAKSEKWNVKSIEVTHFIPDFYFDLIYSNIFTYDMLFNKCHSVKKTSYLKIRTN